MGFWMKHPPQLSPPPEFDDILSDDGNAEEQDVGGEEDYKFFPNCRRTSKMAEILVRKTDDTGSIASVPKQAEDVTMVKEEVPNDGGYVGVKICEPAGNREGGKVDPAAQQDDLMVSGIPKHKPPAPRIKQPESKGKKVDAKETVKEET